MSVTRPCTLDEMIVALHGHPDDEAFRYHQLSYVSPDGSVHPGDCLVLTVGELRNKVCPLESLAHVGGTATLSEEERSACLAWIREAGLDAQLRRPEEATVVAVLKRLVGGG